MPCLNWESELKVGSQPSFESEHWNLADLFLDYFKKRWEMEKQTNTQNSTGPMPVLFIGHGSPMNAIEDNEFAKTWQAVAEIRPKPEAILCISAHWETRGTWVTAMEKPRTIHDFGGFPRGLYEVQYPAPGSPWLTREVKNTVKKITVGLDQDWGLDHGCCSILALKQENETVIYFNDHAVAGSLTMTSLIIDAGLKNTYYASQISMLQSR